MPDVSCLECFFLHSQATERLYRDYPIIWQAPKTDGGNRVGGKNLSRFGSIGLIYEVSGYGGLGTVEDVENIKLYDFYHYLSFIRTSNAKD
jgi:hypothetical protein